MVKPTMLRTIGAAIAFLCISSSSWANITGTVFQDFNSNGVRDQTATIPNQGAAAGTVGVAVDKGLAGVQVTAVCVTNLGGDGILGTADDTRTTFGPVTTSATGAYTITTTGVVAAVAPKAACRVEFSWNATSPFVAPANVLQNPLFGMRPTFVGSGSNTATQFVNDAAIVNLGLNYPADFCQNNPTLTVNCARYGDISGAIASPLTALHALPYNARTADGTGTSTPASTQLSTFGQLGSTYGLAYHRPTNKILVGAYFKRHIGVGPGGLGQIYAVNATGAAGTSNFLNLETLIPGSAGTNPRAGGAAYNYEIDASVVVGGDLKVGKLGLGDVEMSEDQRTLYAIGLNSRKLYVMPVGLGLTAPAAGAISEITLPDPGTVAGTGCPRDAATPAGQLNLNLRPFALKHSRGFLYVGMTCTAESTGAAADLRSFVYRYDGTTFTQIANTSLNYNLSAGLDWNAWDDLGDSNFTAGCCAQRPQPLLADIEFSASGDLILGVRDRYGDLIGLGAQNLTGNGTVDGRGHGDLIRACIAPATGLYSPASCTPNGVGWFQDSGLGGLLPDPNGSMGGLAQVPGFPDVVQTVKDPTLIYGGGLFWHNTATGGPTKGYQLLTFGVQVGNVDVNGGKASGLGDIEVLCAAAPLEVGNRVWADANGNGVQDPGEAAIAGVTVRLYAPDGTTVLATAVTDANGQYAFSNRTADENGAAIAFPGAAVPTTGVVNAIPGFNSDTTGYSIRFDNPANYAAGGPLANLVLAPANAGGVTTNDPLTDLTDSDAVLPTPASPIGAGNYPQIAFNTGGAGENNFGLDAGFAPLVPTYSLGNRIWYDTNNNGILDAGELPIVGVRVELVDSTGAKLYRTPGGVVTPVAAGNTAIEATTDANGYYRFDDLLAGTYAVRVAASNWTGTGVLVGYANSSFTGAGATTGAGDPNGTTAVNNTDKGIDNATPATNGILSRNVTLGAGVQPSGEDTGATGAGAAGPSGDVNDNRTVDFGFYRLTVGNTIWLDNGTGGGTANNGLKDGTEAGIDGVKVELLDAGGTVVATTTTAGGGLYSFTQQTDAAGVGNGNPLLAGNYTIRVPGGQAALTGLFSSADPSGVATPLSADNDDNGTGTNAATGATVTSTFALAAGTNGPTGATATNATATTDQPRVDLGFAPAPANLSIGNRVFLDPNNNGRQDPGELGIANAQVRLLDAAGVPVTGVPVQNTDANGYYRFDGLPAGTYIVEVIGSTLPAGSVNSTGTQAAGDQGDRGLDTPVAGNYRSAPVVLAAGGQPTGETDLSGTGQGAQGPGGDANTNSLIDFGFVPPTYSIGNRVWRDNNNDGLRAATGEPGIDGVVMNLFAADAVGNPTGAILATTTTAAGGYYRFDGLAAGDYIVVVAGSNFATGSPLKSLASSAVTQANANTDIDNDDNGIDAANPAAAGIRSGRITVGPGTSEPTAETDLVAGANPQGSPDAQANMTVDFGFYPLASLGDRVFLDTNGNGIQDAGETGVPGVTVKLLDATGNPVLDPVTGLAITAITNGTGNYLFTDLPAGSYQVEFMPPAGYVISPKDQGGNDATDSDADPTTRRSPVVTLAPGESNLTVDAGLFFTASLGDRVWHDLNKNGTQDAGEPGVSGVTVNLRNAADAIVATTTTDGSGNYNFTGLTPGVPYTVEFTNLPAGYRFTTQGPGASTSDPADSDANAISGRTAPITLTSGQSDPNWDAGIFGPIDLTLTKAVAPVAPATGSPYLTGEQVEYTITVANLGPATALAGYTVTDLVPAGLATPTLVTSTGFTPCAFTGSTLSCTGTANLAAGAANALTITYRATIAAASGTVKNIAYVDKAATDPSAETNPLGTPPTATTNASTSPTNNDGDATITVNATTYSLGNRVWVDTNNNGTIDPTEVGRNGVTVELIDGTTNTVVASTVTAGGGYYRFDGLAAGNYIVQIAASNFTGTGGLLGYTSSGPTETDPNSDVDSNDNGLNTPVAGAIRSGVVTLGPAASEPTTETDIANPNPAGESPNARSNLTVDFGFVPPASLGNLVFNDTNGNGLQDAGELGVSGVTVTLLDAAGVPVPGVAPQITDAGGNYLFTNLVPGTYSVGFTNLPTGTVFTTANQGANDAIDSDVDPTTGRTGTVTLAPGETNLTVDAGIRTQAGVTVGNFVWRDNNSNGIQDAGEPGVQGVTATITRVGGGPVTDVTGTPIASTTTITDATGNYQFTNLAPGQYTITFSTLPAGFTPTTTNAAGSTTTNDSNGLTATSAVLTAGQSDLSLDLGLIPPATPTFSVGNRVFTDTNNNGRQDPGEAGLAGVQVRLLNATNTPITGATQTTDANGYYRFDNLPAGTYTVEVIGTSLPTGVTSSTGTQTGDQGDKGIDTAVAGNYRSAPVTLGTGLQPTGETDIGTGAGAQGPSGDAGTNSTIDFGFVAPVGSTATITGVVFTDPNRDGTKAPTEGGVPAGTVVNLVNPLTGAIVATTTTGANGTYTFTNVAPGNYSVVVPTPPGGTTATTATSVPVTAVAGTTATAPNVGFGPANGTATVTGVVFTDPNRDGTKGPTEGGVPAGTVVNLVNPTTGAIVATTTTNANGNYTFTNVVPGNYNVVVPTPPGGTSATTATSVPVTATANTTATAPNVGFGPATEGGASVIGNVFIDPNRDGTKGPNENGAAGVIVSLVNAAGVVVATTTTDASGNYTFPNVPAGSYSIVATVPAGLTATTLVTRPVTVPAAGVVTAPSVGLVNPFTTGEGVPTLSEWALILLAMMLGAIGVRQQRGTMRKAMKR
jgi:protocatechuate 3,4-dioxygenase beta subunit